MGPAACGARGSRRKAGCSPEPRDPLGHPTPSPARPLFRLVTAWRVAPLGQRGLVVSCLLLLTIFQNRAAFSVASQGRFERAAVGKPSTVTRGRRQRVSQTAPSARLGALGGCGWAPSARRASASVSHRKKFTWPSRTWNPYSVPLITSFFFGLSTNRSSLIPETQPSSWGRFCT